MDRSLRFGALTVDLDSGESDPGPPITGKELAVLRHLAACPGRVVSRDALLRAVWGYHPSVLTRVVDLTISRLRRRIEPCLADPAWLKTVHGEGYVLVAAPRTGDAPPLDSGPFVGRAAHLDFLLRWAAAPESPWLTVVGPPGIGKSRLLRELQARVPSTLVPVGAAWDSNALAGILCRALGLRLENAGDAPSALARALDRRALLLLLDDLDGLHGPAEALRNALAACPDVRVVATARRALGFPGEPLLRLGPIEDAAARSLAMMFDAPGLPVADAAGNPLAITLHAAAHRAGASAEPGLDGALRSAWNRLAPDDRRLFARLSLFAGRFDEGAAIEAFAARADALDRLVEEGLVELWGERLGLHPAVRAFAKRELERSEDGPAARARHAAYHLDDLAARLVGSAGPCESLDVLTTRLDDLDAAWAWATAAGDLSRLARARPAAQELVARAGLWVHGERWLGLPPG